VAKTLDEKMVRAIAESEQAPARASALGFHRLRSAKKKVPPKVLLGCIVEAPMDGKLDTFAVYADGGIRYINAQGKIAYSDGVTDVLVAPTRQVMLAARDIAERTKPATQKRQALASGRGRVTVLASDGPYVIEAPMETLMKDKLAGPALQACGLLLKTFADMSLQQRAWHEAEQKKQ
jgi:hypothetical protein